MTTGLGLLGLALFNAWACCAAIPPNVGTANGVLKIDGREIPLKHAYAVAEVPELAMPDQGKDGFDLLVTDRALSDAEVGCRTLLMHGAQAGTVHGVILSLIPGKQETPHGAILYGKVPAFFTVTGTNDQYKIQAKTLTFQAVSARVWTPRDIKLDLPGSTPVTVRYDATVETMVQRPGPVTATVTGEAARQSPQYRALSGFLKAMKSGDAAALTASCAKGQGALFAGPDGRQFVEAVRQGAWEPAKLRTPKVIIRSNIAVITGKVPEPVGDVAMKLVNEGGQWKVSLN